MAMTNAQRQAKHRAKERDIDAQIMDRLFGPRLDLSDKGVQHFVSEVSEVAKGVDSRTGFAPEAYAVLFANIVRSGLGAQPMGWSLEQDGEWTRLQVHVYKAAQVKAA